MNVEVKTFYMDWVIGKDFVDLKYLVLAILPNLLLVGVAPEYVNGNKVYHEDIKKWMCFSVDPDYTGGGQIRRRGDTGEFRDKSTQYGGVPNQVLDFIRETVEVELKLTKLNIDSSHDIFKTRKWAKVLDIISPAE